MEDFPQVSTPAADRDQPGLRRSEPSSRRILIGEQPTYHSFIAKSIDYIFPVFILKRDQRVIVV